MTRIGHWLLVAALAALLSTPALHVAQAKTLNQSEIRAAMLGKPIFTRRFGMSIRMVYRANGTVTAKALLGTINGTWRPRGRNQICTTFPSGPAKGTSCVSYTKTGPNRYRTSEGVNFRVGG